MSQASDSMSPQSSSTLVEVAQPPAKVSWSVMPQRRWDDPQLSAGTPHASLDILGRFKCWSLKDKSPVHMMWKTVSTAIISLLEDRYEHLDARGSELMVEMFMIGRKPTSTSPTILFSCESKTCRQKAMGLVKKKGILKDHPGVLMAECSKLPRPLALVEELDAPQLPPGIYLNGPLLNFGTSVLVYSKEGFPPRKATIGGFVTIEDELFGVTAAHTFFPPEGEGTSDDENIEFAFFGDEEPYDSGDDEELVDLTSRASLSSGSSNSPSLDESEHSFQASVTSNSGSTSNEKVVSERIHPVIDMGDGKTTVKLGDLFASTEVGERLDWALVKIRASSASYQARAFLRQSYLTWGTKIIYPKSVENASSDVGVLISTGSSGIVEGTLSPVSSFVINADTHAAQSLLTVRRSLGKFSDGDCGSWVFDKETGDVYGHIVSGFPATAIAYIVPSLQIFQDIKRRIAKPVELFAPMANKSRERISGNSDSKIHGSISHRFNTPRVRQYDREINGLEITHSTSASSSRIEPVVPQMPAKIPVVPRPAHVVDIDDDGKTINGSKRNAKISNQKLKPKRASKGKGKEKVEDKAKASAIIPKPRYSISSNASNDSGYASSRHSTVSFASDILGDEGERGGRGSPEPTRIEASLRQRNQRVRKPNSAFSIDDRLAQPIPTRPRAVNAQTNPTRPVSYHASRTAAEHGPPLSASAWANWKPTPVNYGLQPLNYSSSGVLGQEGGVNLPGQVAERSFLPKDTGSNSRRSIQKSRYSISEETEDDDGYGSAPEVPTSGRSVALQFPLSSNSTVDDTGMPRPWPVIRSRPITAEQDYLAMPPLPPRPILRRPVTEYSAESSDTPYREERTFISDDSRPRRPRLQRNSISYDLGDGPERVRVEIANSGRGRQTYYDQTAIPHRPISHRNAVSYDLRDGATHSPPPSPPPLLTAEVLRGYRGQSGSSSASRSTRSGSSDGWKSSSTAPTDYGDSENATIKVTGMARVVVGGAQIDCQDGGEIETRPARSRGQKPDIGNASPARDEVSSRRGREEGYMRFSGEVDDKANNSV